MQSVVKHEIIEAGATFKREFIYQDTNGDLVDLTGWAAQMKVKRAVTDTAAVVTQAVVIDVANAKISYTMSVATTALLADGVYVYAIEISKAGEVIRLVEGNMTVSPEVVK